MTGSYQRRPYLEDMVASVRRVSAGVEVMIVVVDGGSADGTREWVRAQNDCHLIEQEGPLTGAVRAFNLGYAWAIDHDYPYVGHLNDDMVLETESMIGRAIAVLEQNPKVGEVAFASDLRGPYEIDTVHGYPYANFGIIRREAGMAVGRAQGDPEGKAWWNPIYRTYGADCELGCWIWRLGYEVYAARDLRVHDRTREVFDTLRLLNGSNDPNRQDSQTFWRRWAHKNTLKTGPRT